MKTYGGHAVWLVVVLFLLAACDERAPLPDRLVLEPVGFDALTGWGEDAQEEALATFRRSCDVLRARPDDASLGAAGTVADWRGTCEAALALEEPFGDARGFFEAHFTPVATFNNDEREGLYTGYYEPELAGARAPRRTFATPLYARPDDLVSVDLGAFRPELQGTRIAGWVIDGRLVPYASRAEIEDGALEGRGLELVWVEDPNDAFFLQIQGSGKIRFEDGAVRRIGYADSNGHVYFPIGRALVARGELTREEVSLQSIRAWLEAHPDAAPELRAQNPSYIFFRWLPGDDSAPGPLGAQGVALTPGRSLAVDTRFVALGIPLWLEARVPGAGPGLSDRSLRRLLVAQDTGSAIKGPLRGDVFWGSGAAAEWLAGQMKAPGRSYLLLPAAVARRLEEHRDP
ncbi:MAG: murein transglycosylase A [Alphaproteobacteria bacterium]